MLCKEMLGSLSDYIDGELEAELCAEIDRHVAECDNCSIVVDTLRRDCVAKGHVTEEDSR